MPIIPTAQWPGSSGARLFLLVFLAALASLLAGEYYLITRTSQQVAKAAALVQEQTIAAQTPCL